MRKQGKIYGQPRNEPLPVISLGQLLLDKMREHINRVVLIDGDNGNQMTYRELLEKSVKLATFLQKYGVKFGDRICVACENRIDWFVPILATLYFGGICVPYNSMYTEWELRNMLNISRPLLVFVSKRTEKIFRKIQTSCSWQMVIIELDDEPFMSDILTLTDILTVEKVDLWKFKAANIGDYSKHPAVILNSSGTTGLPKGVTLSHKNILSFVIESSKEPFIYVTQSDRYLIFLPFYHGYAFGLFLISLIRGISSVIMSNFELERFMKLIEEYKVTVVPVVPPIMVLLAKHPMVEKYDFRSVRQIICGAAPLPKEIVSTVKSRLGVKCIRNAYGMTEITVMSSMSDLGTDDTICLDILLPGIYSKIVDVETQETLDVGQSGEICFKGEQVMLEYWNNPEATKQIIDKDGWLHTGDIGYYDERDALHVVDRMKELIKYKGYQVSPSEIETVLLSHSAVKEVAVCGRPDPNSGELPVAMIVKHPDATVTAEDIVQFIKQKLSPQKWLRGGVQFVDAIPKNPTGKILRREVQSMIQAMASKL